MTKLFNINKLAVLIIILFCINIYGQDKTLNFPNTAWSKHDSFKKKGYDSKKINKIREYIIDNMNTTGLVVVVDGKILFEYGDIEELSYIASCRKSILSMMYGKYVENNTINLDKTLEDIGIDDIQGLLPIERQATIRHLITARSGIYHPRSNGGDNTRNAPERGSVVPGTHFLYNNWDFNAAGGIFEKLINKNIYKVFEEDLAIPLQFQDFKLEKQQKRGDATKSKFLAYHFWLSTRDMARLGLLMLNNGNWDGIQLISEKWVKRITSTITPVAPMNLTSVQRGLFEYGYMWWLWYHDSDETFKGAYLASGAYGQFLLVIPKLNMVISHKTKYVDHKSTQFSEFRDLVYKIIESKTE